MKKPALALLMLAIGALASTAVLAHGRSRVVVGFSFGVPVYWGYPYYYPPPPYYYYPPTVVYSAPPAPPAYVERNPPEPQQQGWWYYCEQTRGYYPYVKHCPGGWQRVPPAPPPAGG